jgi:hypothetical protein
MKKLLMTVLGVCMFCVMASSGKADEAKPGLFTVIKAQYGAGETWADVKDKVVAAVKDDALTIDATNENFGDPVEGTAKSLTVVVKYNGVELTFAADEHATLTIDKAALDAAAKEKAAQDAAANAAK